MPNKHIDITLKAQAFTLVEFAEYNMLQAAEVTGISVQTISQACKKAQALGFDWETCPAVWDEFFTAAARSGRPAKATEEVKQQLRATVEKSHDITLDELANSLPIGRTTIARVLKALNMHKCKPTTKPSLTAKMQKDRLDFCLLYKDKDLEW